jgi:membrane-associated phospholipid phosphatase
VDSILDRGIDVVLWFQQFSPALDAPFLLMTFMGDQEFFMLMLPFVYWCVDRSAGSRLIFFFLLSVYLNQIAKELLDQPRPFQYDSRVRQLTAASGGGLPSGHTQQAVAVWGFVALYWRRPWARCAAAVLIIGIPLSRVYLGVHFPTDLLGGYLIGGTLLWLYVALAPSIVDRLSRQSLTLHLFVITVLSLGLTVVDSGGGANGIRLGGVLMGLGIGLVLERRLVRFEAGGWWGRRLGAYLVGVAVLFGVYYGLRVLFSDLEPVSFWRYLRYALVGFWGAFGAPWVFVRLKLLPTGS